MIGFIYIYIKFNLKICFYTKKSFSRKTDIKVIHSNNLYKNVLYNSQKLELLKLLDN